MTRYLTRDRAAIAAAFIAPLAAAAVLLPFRSSWPNTNVALLLVVVVVAVAAITDAGYLAQIHQTAALTPDGQGPGRGGRPCPPAADRAAGPAGVPV